MLKICHFSFCSVSVPWIWGQEAVVIEPGLACGPLLSSLTGTRPRPSCRVMSGCFSSRLQQHGCYKNHMTCRASIYSVALCRSTEAQDHFLFSSGCSDHCSADSSVCVFSPDLLWTRTTPAWMFHLHLELNSQHQTDHFIDPRSRPPCMLPAQERLATPRL